MDGYKQNRPPSPMATLRWKPLKSSAKQARALTNLLEGFNILITALILVCALGSLIWGLYLPGLLFLILSPVVFICLKIGYVALELLTEIADDTRLQLLAISEDDYDVAKIVSNTQTSPKKPRPSSTNPNKSEIFRKAMESYKQFGNAVCSFTASEILEDRVILRDVNGDFVIEMELSGDEWTPIS